MPWWRPGSRHPPTPPDRATSQDPHLGSRRRGGANVQVGAFRRVPQHLEVGLVFAHEGWEKEGVGSWPGASWQLGGSTWLGSCAGCWVGGGVRRPMEQGVGESWRRCRPGSRRLAETRRRTSGRRSGQLKWSATCSRTATGSRTIDGGWREKTRGCGGWELPRATWTRSWPPHGQGLRVGCPGTTSGHGISVALRHLGRPAWLNTMGYPLVAVPPLPANLGQVPMPSTCLTLTGHTR